MLKILESLKNIDNIMNRAMGLCSANPHYPENIKTRVFQDHPVYLDLIHIVCDTLCINDVSGSMSRKDCKPSRLGAAKKAAEAYIKQRFKQTADDRIGLIWFNHTAEIVLELTGIGNIELILKELNSLKTGGGTDITEGLKAAKRCFTKDNLYCDTGQRLRRILLLTDGNGGHPVRIAKNLKEQNILIEVIGIGGSTSAVNEELLKKVATTDASGFTHYWFFKDTQALVSHYEKLATGIVFRGKTND